MIKIIKGSLLDTDCSVIAHQVNCRGKMNSGVAKQLSEKYLELYDNYKDFIDQSDEPVLGKNCIVAILTEDDEIEKIIVNMFSQNNFGYDGAQYTDYKALEECFKQLKHFLTTIEYKKVAMPYRIGCGRGGASWSIVYNMIDRIFYDCEVELWRLEEEQ